MEIRDLKFTVIADQNEFSQIAEIMKNNEIVVSKTTELVINDPVEAEEAFNNDDTIYFHCFFVETSVAIDSLQYKLNFRLNVPDLSSRDKNFDEIDEEVAFYAINPQTIVKLFNSIINVK